jgi:hypothetical protein
VGKKNTSIIGGDGMKFYKLLMIIFYLVILTGCQDSPDKTSNDSANQAPDNPIVGTYYVIDSTEVSQKDYVELKSDGKFDVYNNSYLSMSGWYEVENGIIIVSDEDGNIEGRLKIEGEIIFNLEDPQIRFVRKGFEDTVKKTFSSTEGDSTTFASSGKCGAYVAPGVWKEFDCYNLAAIGKDTSADPFTPSWELIGGYWQWGRKGPDQEDWYNTNTEHFAHGPTGPGESEANDGSISSWDDDYAPDGSWSDSHKTANDPCPTGYRVFTKSQWDGVRNNNIQSTVGSWSESATNYSSARFFGDKLMLPAAGGRDSTNGALYIRGKIGAYWSSSERSGDSAWAHSAWAQAFSSKGDLLSGPHPCQIGFSVRCVAE